MSACDRSPATSRRLRGGLLLIALASLPAALGCGPTEIDSVYGRRRGALGGESVNGTAVLADMFRRAGYRVGTWRRISPRLENYQVIVWAPDDLKPPTDEQCERLSEWLDREGERRTLVYIGRDYDAAVTYWKRVQKAAPPDQIPELARRAAIEQASHDQRRAEMENTDFCNWFKIERDHPKTSVRSLDDDCAWRAGIEPAKLGIEIESRILPPPPTRAGLLRTPGSLP